MHTICCKLDMLVHLHVCVQLTSGECERPQDVVATLSTSLVLKCDHRADVQYQRVEYLSYHGVYRIWSHDANCFFPWCKVSTYKHHITT